jgi:sortase A
MATLAPPPVRSERRRRALRALSTVLIAGGLLVLVDAVLTLVWQEPLTALQTTLRQRDLRGDLRLLEAQRPTRLEARALAGLADERRRVALLARSLQRRTAPGAAIGRLKIGRLGADLVMVKGADPSDLRKGPGTFDDLPLPGAGPTVAVAGHRTTYGAPFRHVDRMRAGDRITVEMPYATFTYRVQRTRVVAPDAVWVLRDAGYDRLVLSACHPLFSSAQRIVVVSRLTRVVPLRAARAGQGSEFERLRLTRASSRPDGRATGGDEGK